MNPESPVGGGNGQFGKVPMVRFERTLPGPIERVWEFLSTTERLPA